MATAPKPAHSSFAAVAANGAGAGASARDRQRTIAATAATVGCVVRVQTIEGVVYQGTVKANSLAEGVVLNNAHRCAGLTDGGAQGDIVPVLVVRRDNLAQIVLCKQVAPAASAAPAAAAIAAATAAAAAVTPAAPASSAPPATAAAAVAGRGAATAAAAVAAPAKAAAAAPAAAKAAAPAANLDSFTDGAIAARAPGQGLRELQRWDAHEASLSSASTALSGDKSSSWSSKDMLREHDKQLKKEGKQSNYSELLYTSKLNMDAPDAMAQRAEAERLAREIERDGLRKDTALENSMENEEALYSQVQSAPPPQPVTTVRPMTQELKTFAENLKLDKIKSSNGAAPSPAPAASSSPTASATVTKKLNPNAVEFVPTRPILPAQHMLPQPPPQPLPPPHPHYIPVHHHHHQVPVAHMGMPHPMHQPPMHPAYPMQMYPQPGPYYAHLQAYPPRGAYQQQRN